MQVISRFNKGTMFLICVIDIFKKNTWVVPLKDKKGLTVVNDFQNFLDNSTKSHSMRKPNEIWLNKGSEFYNSSFKELSKDNDIEMYSAHNEGKYVVAVRFIRTLKNKIYKHMTAVSKNVYIDKLDDIVNEYMNTTIHVIEQLKWSLLKIKIIHISTLLRKLMTMILNIKLVIIFAKGYAPNWSEEVFVVKKN